MQQLVGSTSDCLMTFCIFNFSSVMYFFFEFLCVIPLLFLVFAKCSFASVFKTGCTLHLKYFSDFVFVKNLDDGSIVCYGIVYYACD